MKKCFLMWVVFVGSVLAGQFCLAKTAPAAFRLSDRLIHTGKVRSAVRVGADLWLATSGGLVRVCRNGRDDDNRAEVGKRTTLWGPEAGVPVAPLHALAVDSKGRLWVGGKGGLAAFALTPGGIRLVRRVHVKDVRDLIATPDALYIASWGEGLLSLDLRKAFAPQTTPSSQGRCLPGNQERTRHRKSGLKRMIHGSGRRRFRATSLARRKGTIYVGTAGAGVAVLKAGRRTVSWVSRQLPSRLVWDLVADARGVWTATSGGLVLLRGARVVRGGKRGSKIGGNRLSNRDLRSVAVAKSSVIVGTYGWGAWRLAGGALSQLGSPSRTARVHSVQTMDGELYFGTDDGLYRGGNTTPVFLADGPRSNNVSTMARVGEGELWVGTFDNGISVRTVSGWRHLSMANGLIDDRINVIVPQRVFHKGATSTHRVWVATPRGLAYFDRGEWHSLFARDHLPPGHVTGIYVDGSRVWIASSNGLASIRIRETSGQRGRPEIQRVVLNEAGVRKATAVLGVGAELWVGGIGGLAVRRHGRWRRYGATSGHLPDNWVTALIYHDGDVFAGTYDGGLARVGKRRRLFTETNGLPCGWVNSHALLSWDARLWVGTMEGGLLMNHGDEWRQFGLRDGLPSLDVTALVPSDKNGLWVATRAGVVHLERTERLDAR